MRYSVVKKLWLSRSDYTSFRKFVNQNFLFKQRFVLFDDCRAEGAVFRFQLSAQFARGRKRAEVIDVETNHSRQARGFLMLGSGYAQRFHPFGVFDVLDDGVACDILNARAFVGERPGFPAPRQCLLIIICMDEQVMLRSVKITAALMSLFLFGARVE